MTMASTRFLSALLTVASGCSVTILCTYSAVPFRGFGFFDDVEADLLQPPEQSDDERALVSDERRLLAFERVAHELEGPPDGEHAGGEG